MKNFPSKMKMIILTNKNLGIMPNDTMEKIEEKRARPWDLDEISAQDVLRVINVRDCDLMRNQHNFELSAAPAELRLANGGRLEKNGDFYIVHNNCGISFIIRKLGDKRIHEREARTSLGRSLYTYTYLLPHISFSYVDIDRDSDSIKIERINDNIHDPKILEDLFRKHLKW